LGFDRRSKMITDDLRKTLKAEEYPTLAIRFLSLERTPGLQARPSQCRGGRK
jgi:hypothetical protein